MKKSKLVFGLMAIAMLFNSQNINAHCEVPCGIYADSVRITMMIEHVTTIEKAMNSINKLSAEKEINYNQLVRWVVNKEEHAEKIQKIVSQYFLHQRIKLVDPNNEKLHKKYLNQLSKLHEILIHAMKSKQSTDLKVIDNLKKSIDDFSSIYFHKH